MHIQAKLVNGEVIEQYIDSNTCIIGRSSKCDVVIPHEGMSRTHCQIDLIGGEFFVTDLGSTNGVFIDQQKLEPHRKTPYQTFLSLSFGPVQSLQVTEEVSPPHYGQNVLHPGPASTSQNTTSFTRTKILKETQKGMPTPPVSSRKERNQEKIAKFRLWLSSAAGLILIALAAFWYIKSANDKASEGFELINKDPEEIEEKTYDQF